LERVGADVPDADGIDVRIELEVRDRLVKGVAPVPAQFGAACDAVVADDFAVVVGAAEAGAAAAEFFRRDEGAVGDLARSHQREFPAVGEFVLHGRVQAHFRELRAGVGTGERRIAVLRCAERVEAVCEFDHDIAARVADGHVVVRAAAQDARHLVVVGAERIVEFGAAHIEGEVGPERLRAGAQDRHDEAAVDAINLADGRQ